MTEITMDRRIIHRLLMESFFMQNPGLLRGQMGIVLALAEFYGKTRSNKLYCDFWSELLDVLFEHVDEQSPIGFGDGLCGIGWGLEYLIQHRFVDGSGKDVCMEINKKMMQENIRNIEDLTLDNGLEGRLHYILAHIQGCKRQEKSIPFNTDYLYDVYQSVYKLHEMQTSETLKQLSENYILYYQTGCLAEYHFSLRHFVRLQKTDNCDILQAPLGLCDGLAGMLLLQEKKL